MQNHVQTLQLLHVMMVIIKVDHLVFNA